MKRSTKLMLIGAICVTVVAVAYVIVHRRIHAPMPEWRVRAEEYPRVNPNQTHRYMDMPIKAWMWNDLFRADDWSESDAQALIAHFDTMEPGLILADDASLEDRARFHLAHNVAVVAAERLRIRAPVSPEARELIIDMFIRKSRMASPFMRMSAAQLMAYSGLASDPRLRKRLTEMMNDPHPDVSSNAKRQLRAFDETRGNP